MFRKTDMQKIIGCANLLVNLMRGLLHFEHRLFVAVLIKYFSEFQRKINLNLVQYKMTHLIVQVVRRSCNITNF